MVFKVLQTGSAKTILKHSLQVEGLSSIKVFKIVVQPYSTTRSPPLRFPSDETKASGSSVAESFNSCSSSSSLSDNERRENSKTVT